MDNDIFYPEDSPTEFIPLIVDDILNNCKMGLTLKDCAALLKISHTKIQRWYNNNLGNFAYAVDEASATNKRAHVARAQSKQLDRSSQWWLERKYKGEYSKEVTHHVDMLIYDTAAKVFIEAACEVIEDPDLLKRLSDCVLSKMSSARIEDLPVKLITNGKPA